MFSWTDLDTTDRTFLQKQKNEETRSNNKNESQWRGSEFESQLHMYDDEFLLSDLETSTIEK